jgi:hypothetical protein
MKSILKKTSLLLTAGCISALSAVAQAPENLPGLPGNVTEINKTIFHLDSLFWQAYNNCDVEKMASFFTDDLEFYHDKGGLTSTKIAFVESVKKGLCGNADWHLRREPVAGTVRVFPLNNYGALISGEHVFYINETGKKERLDGLAKFTQVWQYKNNEWKMSRVLSYDHGPAPYKNVRKEITVKPALLKAIAGKYQSPQAGTVTITPEGNALKFSTNNFNTMIYPESETLFFLKDRDLQFEFVKTGNKITKMIVHESGSIVEEAKRID